MEHVWLTDPTGRTYWLNHVYDPSSRKWKLERVYQPVGTRNSYYCGSCRRNHHRDSVVGAAHKDGA